VAVHVLTVGHIDMLNGTQIPGEQRLSNGEAQGQSMRLEAHKPFWHLIIVESQITWQSASVLTQAPVVGHLTG
jgi:hypothetical protein